MPRSERPTSDFDDEIEAHLQLEADRLRQLGSSDAEANAAARRSFGNVGQTKERFYERGRWLWWDQLRQDVRLSFRTLLRSPGFTAVAVLTLALGIGANTAIYSVVDAILLRPLPYPESDRIVRVAATRHASAQLPGYSGSGGRDREAHFSDRGYWHFARYNRTFTIFGGYRPQPRHVPLTGEDTPQQVILAQMTRSAFDVLGISPELGRLPTLSEDQPNGPNVALLSHDFWVNHYGADASIVGRTIELFGVSTEVIGIMPSWYNFPTPATEVWIPLRLDPGSPHYEGHNIAAIARLASDATVQSATHDAQRLISQFTEVGYGAEWLVRVFDGGARVWRLQDDVVGDVRLSLFVVFGTVGLVLLIACGNVANLLLVRADGRNRESAVRLALGCGRGRLIRHACTEIVILVLAGGALGLLVALLATQALAAIGPSGIPRLDEVGIRGSAIVFTSVVSLATAVLFGTLPALEAGSRKALSALQTGAQGAGGKRRNRVRNTLLVAQVALAVVVLAGSGLMMRTFRTLRSLDPGFDPRHVLTFDLRPLATTYRSPAALVQFYEQLTERLQSLPGIVHAGAVDYLPLTQGPGMILRAVVAEQPQTEELTPTFLVRRASPQYFDAMSIPIVEGRSFTLDDHRQRSGAVIISHSIKRRYWPHESALDKRITIEGVLPGRIVGVVGDVHDVALETPAEPFIYLPMIDSLGTGGDPMTFVIRAEDDPRGLIPTVRDAIAKLDPELPIGTPRSVESIVNDSISRTTFTMMLLVLGAGVALLLGSVGVYGVIAYIVAQRTPEIAIRLALGSAPRKAGALVLAQGMRLASFGVLIGLAGAAALGRVLASLLFEVSPLDPISLIGAAVLFLAMAFVATSLPARRATNTNPMAVLRND